MAHRLSIQGGRAEMAYHGETPWHGLGTKVDGLQSAQDMLRHAGLLWTVETETLRCAGADVPGIRGVVRQDTRNVLGVVSDRYMPIQNTQAGDMVDALVTEGGAHVEIAGALDNGERCWMLAHIPVDFEVVRDDVVKPYFLLAWGHDGKHGLAGKLTSVRVVCNNTLTAAGFGAGSWKTSANVYVKHSKNATLNIAEARRALGLVRDQVEQTAEAYRTIAGVSLTADQAAEYFTTVFPAPPAEAGNKEGMERWTARQDALTRLYAEGVGMDVPGVRSTAWAAYNAVTDYTDHVYPMLQSGALSAPRQRSVAFGRYSSVKARALTAALALA